MAQGGSSMLARLRCPVMARCIPHARVRSIPTCFLKVAWLILECARPTSTLLSCAFREREDDQACPPPAGGLFQQASKESCPA